VSVLFTCISAFRFDLDQNRITLLLTMAKL